MSSARVVITRIRLDLQHGFASCLGDVSGPSFAVGGISSILWVDRHFKTRGIAAVGHQCNQGLIPKEIGILGRIGNVLSQPTMDQCSHAARFDWRVDLVHSAPPSPSLLTPVNDILQP